jgi:DNA-binding protein H-NS
MDGINIELHKNVVEFDKQIKFLEKLIINQEKLKQEMAMGNTTFVNEINEKINNFEKHINEIFDKLINQYIKNESKPEIKSEIKPEIKPDIYVKSQDSKTIDLNSSAYNFYNYDKNSKKDYNLI